MPQVNFLMAIHSHQPVGNFDGVFATAYEKAYLPFIEVLEKHPNIKLSLHYSGSLLDWLEQAHPEFLEKIGFLIRRGQVEIISGGYYEPIMPLVPLEDSLGQIRMLTDKIKEIFAYAAQGAWTTERVWEPKMPVILSAAGIKYTLLDDSDFEQVGFDIQSLTGFYKTEEQGSCVAIFPTAEKLRYLIPFKLPEESIDYFRARLENKEELTISFGDDGEKFGLWPGTYKWVYKEQWLNNFFTALDNNSDWIKTSTFSEYLSSHSPTSLAYLSCSSYREMLEWSGGYFRNFLVKYPEANNIHKKMFYVSNKLEKVRSQKTTLLKAAKSKATEQKIELARRHLFMGQANDAYWHGIFGGLYLNHLRSNIYRNLIIADKTVDEMMKIKDTIEQIELDCDGQKEIILNSDYINLYFKAQGGALFEFDYKPKSLNLTNTISRRPETYHQRLKEKLVRLETNGSQPSSIHDLKRVKQEGLENLLFYDQLPRYCLWDHFLKTDVSLDEFVQSRYSEQGDFTHSIYNTYIEAKTDKIVFSALGNVQGAKLKLDKGIYIKSKDLFLSYYITNTTDVLLEAVFGIEFNFSVYDVSLSRGIGSLESNSLKLNDLWNQLKINFQFDRQTLIWHFPVETISDSESGAEKSYQELCLLLSWKIRLSGTATFKTDIKISIRD